MSKETLQKRIRVVEGCTVFGVGLDRPKEELSRSITAPDDQGFNSFSGIGRSLSSSGSTLLASPAQEGFEKTISWISQSYFKLENLPNVAHYHYGVISRFDSQEEGNTEPLKVYSDENWASLLNANITSPPIDVNVVIKSSEYISKPSYSVIYLEWMRGVLGAEIVQGPLSELEDLFAMKDPVSIRNFVLKNEGLKELLLEIHVQIRRIFRENVKEIRLKKYVDPEEGVEGLTVTAKTNLDSEKSLDLLDKFDEEWWLGVEDDLAQNLIIQVESCGL